MLVLGSAIILLGLASFVAVQPGVLVRANGNLCDGTVPAWYPGEGGCTGIPSLLEHLWPPERWNAPSYCQGMCLATDGLDEQLRIRDEWRAAHPGAVAR